MKSTMALVAALCLAAGTAAGQAAHDHAHAGATKHETAAATLPMTDGEVRKVDLQAQKITLKHGRLENLGMDPMTMVFRVKDPGWLKTLKAGDKIRFAADRVDGNLTVVALEASAP